MLNRTTAMTRYWLGIGESTTCVVHSESKRICKDDLQRRFAHLPRVPNERDDNPGKTERTTVSALVCVSASRSAGSERTDRLVSAHLLDRRFASESLWGLTSHAKFLFEAMDGTFRQETQIFSQIIIAGFAAIAFLIYLSDGTIRFSL